VNAHFPHTLALTPAPTAEHLVREVREAAEFLDGSVGAPIPGWYTPGADNSDVLRSLYQALADQYPQAGQPLWAVRVWTNLLWQPAYLAVIAVHFSGLVPVLSGMSQRWVGIHIDGYRIADDPIAGPSLESMIDRAGADLRTFADTLLAEVNALTKLKRVPALRLLTDRMLGLMTLLQRQRPDLPAATVRAYSDRWLAAMGLTGQGDLESLFLPNGREVLIIARKGCCLDYLIEPDVYCASCPKQEDAVRRDRQRADALEVHGAA
jgi:siderophore ferric iron reductase